MTEAEKAARTRRMDLVAEICRRRRISGNPSQSHIIDALYDAYREGQRNGDEAEAAIRALKREEA